MKRATELRQKEQDKLKANMKNLTGRMKDILQYKSQQVEDDYFEEFKKNIQKREQMEIKKKKDQEAKNAQFEYDMEKKIEAQMAIRNRQENNRIQLEKRNLSLEKRW